MAARSRRSFLNNHCRRPVRRRGGGLQAARRRRDGAIAGPRRRRQPPRARRPDRLRRQGTGDLRDMLRLGAQCVALCDVDDEQVAKVARPRRPRTSARRRSSSTRDFRRVLDRRTSTP